MGRRWSNATDRRVSMTQKIGCFQSINVITNPSLFLLIGYIKEPRLTEDAKIKQPKTPKHAALKGLSSTERGGRKEKGVRVEKNGPGGSG